MPLHTFLIRLDRHCTGSCLGFRRVAKAWTLRARYETQGDYGDCMLKCVCYFWSLIWHRLWRGLDFRCRVLFSFSPLSWCHSVFSIGKATKTPHTPNLKLSRDPIGIPTALVPPQVLKHALNHVTTLVESKLAKLVRGPAGLLNCLVLPSKLGDFASKIGDLYNWTIRSMDLMYHIGSVWTPNCGLWGKPHENPSEFGGSPFCRQTSL